MVQHVRVAQRARLAARQQPIFVRARGRVAARVEPLRRARRPDHGELVAHVARQRARQALRLDRAAIARVDHLCGGVHAGVGAPGAAQLHVGAAQLRERVEQLLLERDVPVGLAGPAVERRAVVLHAQEGVVARRVGVHRSRGHGDHAKRVMASRATATTSSAASREKRGDCLAT